MKKCYRIALGKAHKYCAVWYRSSPEIEHTLRFGFFCAKRYIKAPITRNQSQILTFEQSHFCIITKKRWHIETVLKKGFCFTLPPFLLHSVWPSIIFSVSYVMYLNNFKVFFDFVLAPPKLQTNILYLQTYAAHGDGTLKILWPSNLKMTSYLMICLIWYWNCQALVRLSRAVDITVTSSGVTLEKLFPLDGFICVELASITISCREIYSTKTKNYCEI